MAWRAGKVGCRQRIWLALACAMAVAACGGAAPARRVTDGERQALAGSRASIEVPAGFSVIDDRTWAREVAPAEAIVLHVESSREPETGAAAHVDALIAEINRHGEAGVERDQVVPLGDLEGRMIQAVELRTAQPRALWMMVAAAEDAMYVASVAGPAKAVLAQRVELERFLASLRIPAPPGAAAGQRTGPAVEVAPLELPDEATPVAPGP